MGRERLQRVQPRRRGGGSRLKGRGKKEEGAQTTGSCDGARRKGTLTRVVELKGEEKREVSVGLRVRMGKRKVLQSLVWVEKAWKVRCWRLEAKERERARSSRRPSSCEGVDVM